MKINNTGSEILRSTYAPGVRSAGAEAAKPIAVQSSTSAGRASDRVQISEAGRALAAQASESTDSSNRAELSPERVAVIRQKILEGAYNSVGVVDEVARRMLERGDI